MLSMFTASERKSLKYFISQWSYFTCAAEEVSDKMKEFNFELHCRVYYRLLKTEND